MQKKIVIRKLDYSDLSEVAEIHRASFTNSSLSRLGKEAIVRYYERQLKSARELYAIGAFIEKKMQGYCFGGLFCGAMSDYLYKNKAFLMKQMLFRPWLILNSTFSKAALSGFKSLTRFAKNINNQNLVIASNNSSEFWILSIASVPSARGLGVGKLLMTDSEQYARENDYKIMRLTVRPDNRNAVQFYEHIGWAKEDELENWQGKMRKVLVND